MEGPWQQSNLDAGASMLIPVPASGGAMVVGESVVTFIAPGVVRSAAIKPTLVKARPACRPLPAPCLRAAPVSAPA